MDMYFSRWPCYCTNIMKKKQKRNSDLSIFIHLSPKIYVDMIWYGDVFCPCLSHSK